MSSETKVVTKAVEASAALLPEIKHPLQNSWTFWIWRNIPNKDWKLGLIKLCDFKTVEEFWAVYNHMPNVSILKDKTDVSLFKNGMEPMWEDPGNKNGGRWLISCPRQADYKGEFLDNMWLEILMGLVGEGFGDANDQICGAVLNIRTRGDKLAVWTSDCQASIDTIKAIGKKVKELAKVNIKIAYESHQATISKHGSTAQNMISL